MCFLGIVRNGFFVLPGFLREPWQENGAISALFVVVVVVGMSCCFVFTGEVPFGGFSLVSCPDFLWFADLLAPLACFSLRLLLIRNFGRAWGFVP